MKSGRGIEDGVRLIHLTAGTATESRYRGLTEHFSPHELQVKLTWTVQELKSQVEAVKACSSSSYRPRF